MKIEEIVDADAEESKPEPKTKKAQAKKTQLKEVHLIVSTMEAARFFNVTRKTIVEWGKKGAPKAGHGKWNLKHFFDWWWENIASDRALEKAGDESLNEARRQYWWAKAMREELGVAKMRDELIPREQVYDEWAARVGLVTVGLEALVTRLPPILVGKGATKIAEIIKQEVRALRKSYMIDGKYTPKSGTQADRQP